MRRSLLLLFSLALAPLAMQATPTFQATGYGGFVCASAAPRPGFGTDVHANIWGSDGHGNAMTVNIDGGPFSGQPTCTGSFPTFSVSIAYGYGDPHSGPFGAIDYDGVTYNFGDFFNTSLPCSASLPNVRCNIAYTASATGSEASLDVALTYWSLGFYRDGKIVGETEPMTVDIGGAVNVTSTQVTEEVAWPGTNPNNVVPFVSGTFTMGDVPEPAAWSLIACAAPLLFLYIKRKKLSITQQEEN